MTEQSGGLRGFPMYYSVSPRVILAGMAMQGMYFNQEMLSALGKAKGDLDIQEAVAQAAVYAADALLERLESDGA